jgi:hypothetical protein
MHRQIILNDEPPIRRERLDHLFEKQNVAWRVASIGDYHCGLSSRWLEGTVDPTGASSPVVRLNGLSLRFSLPFGPW